MKRRAEGNPKQLSLTSVPFLYTYASVISWGVWGFLSKVAFRSLTGSGLKVWVFFGQSAAVLIIIAIIRGQVRWHRVGTACALLCGFLGGMGDLTLYAALHQGGPSSILIPFTALAPVVTVLLAVPLLHERLGWRQVCGVILAIVAGILLAA